MTQKISRGRRVALFALLAGAAACEDPIASERKAEETWTEPPSLQGRAIVADYELVQLGVDEVPWYRWIMDPSADFPRDEDGVPIERRDFRTVYHPVNIAQRGLAYIHMFETSGDSALLRDADRFARRLMQEADVIGGAMYFPYMFDFDLHGIPGETMFAPWYSGLAQSQILSLLLRLHAVTGDTVFGRAADQAARSYLRLRNDVSDYTSRIDSAGYYWIDEYPMPEPTGTLNGFMSGIVGAYEYWMQSGDPEFETVVLAGLATVKAHIHLYRVPGGISYYCLRHRAQYEAYHWIHIELLRWMTLISGDPYFGEMADLLVSDVSG